MSCPGMKSATIEGDGERQEWEGEGEWERRRERRERRREKSTILVVPMPRVALSTVLACGHGLSPGKACQQQAVCIQEDMSRAQG